MTPLKARIAQAKERADKATPGPWEWFPSNKVDPREVRLSFGGFENGGRGYSLWTGIRPSDAALIAHSRADIPYLADQLSRAVELLERVTAPAGSFTSLLETRDAIAAFLAGAQ